MTLATLLTDAASSDIAQRRSCCGSRSDQITLQRFIIGELPDPPVVSGRMAYRSVLPADHAIQINLGTLL